MALLEHVTTRALHPLAAHHTIGRSASCDLQLDARYVSHEHASVRWTIEGWSLCDLGSRNGTFVDGQRLQPGARITIARGQVLAFGHPDEAWRVVDDTPPCVMAVCSQTGAVVRAEDGMLALPSADEPEVTVYEGSDQLWYVEREGVTARLTSRDLVPVGEHVWRVSLPSVVADTTTVKRHAGLTLGAVRAQFRVSLDEEYVELALFFGEQKIDLGARAFHHCLLALARARAADARDPAVPETARGWVYKDDLLRALGVNENVLNLHIFHARQELARAGVKDATAIVERRGATRQLRIGVAQVDEVRI